ncbi:MAG TPA: hypothetical protein PLU39_14990 [Armatimonadota bacterium]|nr:DUF4385 domain-containing protein [Armatimonadota bacterium]HOJ20531.1 hypothetical protein [Armatimonadota bacterium]HOM82381.1 hypothetical protein [Armatimonadota bacterium]HPO73448.1 hypothetical protein [Armatimonadota bacterium]HPT99170.1 hypothetical protein [Armatimonadota bacterium]
MATRVTKKEQAVELHDQGLSVEEIASRLKTSPTYVANTLIESGRTPEYFDLYTHTGPQNPYARRLAGVLRFRTPEAARASILHLDEIFHEYEAQGDLRGQHQVQLLALVGRNRAEGIGKLEAADLFTDWLLAHLMPRRRMRRRREERESRTSPAPGH